VSFKFKLSLFVIFVFAVVFTGQIVPGSGVFLCGVIVATLFEVTRLRFKHNFVAISFIMISTSTLLWGWVGPHIGIFARPLAQIMFAFWGIYCFSSSQRLSWKRISIPSISAVFLGLFISLQNYHNLVSPLLWGYDNSANVPALSQVYRHSGFVFTGNIPEFFTFSNFVNGYPPLQSGAWSFIMSIAQVQISGGYEILRYFTFFLFGTGLLIIYFVSNYWTLGLSNWFKRRNFRTLVFALVAFLVAFSQASYLFWLGYPSFLWTCCLITALIVFASELSNQSHRVLLIILGLTLVNYSYPLVSPVVALVLLVELSKMSRTDYAFCWQRRQIVSLIALLTSLLNFPMVIKTLKVRSYIDDAGGIQPSQARNILPMVLFAISVIYISRISFRQIPMIVTAFLASTLNFFVLALYSKIDQGSVSYYPLKTGYLAYILGFACMGALLDKTPQFTNAFFKNTFQLGITLTAIAIVLFSVYTTYDPNYAKYGYVSTSMVRRELSNPDQCFLNAMDLTADLDDNSSKTQILFLQSDLKTRWINGVRGRLTDATYSLSIPIGQNSQTLPTILKKWFDQFPDVHLLILAPKPPIEIENMGENISFREFACD
jgi:hypothetical protein